MFNTAVSVENRFNHKQLKDKKHQKADKRIKKWKPKGEGLLQIFEKRNSVHHGGWKELSTNVLETAKEACCVTVGRHRKQREA